MQEKLDTDGITERVEAVIEKCYQNQFRRSRSSSLQRTPNYSEWVDDPDTHPDGASYEQDDILRALREGLLAICVGVNEVIGPLEEQFQQERLERQRLKAEIDALRDAVDQ